MSGLIHFHIHKHLIVLFAFPISRLQARPQSIKFSTKINQILVLIKILVLGYVIRFECTHVQS